MASARYALILDDEASALGSVALRLLRLGIDTSYAKDRDEAILWAQQEAERIHAVLFPSSVDMVSLASAPTMRRSHTCARAGSSGLCGSPSTRAHCAGS